MCVNRSTDSDYMAQTEAISIREIIEQALLEDLGSAGDVTSEAVFGKDETATALIRSKSSGVLSGTGCIPPIFTWCDSGTTTDLHLSDGAELAPGTPICTVCGPVRALLSGERTALNFVQRLSGIATMTARYAGAIAHTGCRLLDTRKTTPLLRTLEKKAVLHGGGHNHRFGLFDMILIKDTHVKRAGGITKALEKAIAFRKNHHELAIEVEVQSVSEFLEALACHPERIMLDNMSTGDMRRCVTLRNEQTVPVELEASGNVTLESISAIAETGVDFISSGALTHSAPSLDIHLVIQ
jgi:nicotinate-nucleotide pyrophosphorylase (carboxylating)